MYGLQVFKIFRYGNAKIYGNGGNYRPPASTYCVLYGFNPSIPVFQYIFLQYWVLSQIRLTRSYYSFLMDGFNLPVLEIPTIPYRMGDNTRLFDPRYFRILSFGIHQTIIRSIHICVDV